MGVHSDPLIDRRLPEHRLTQCSEGGEQTKSIGEVQKAKYKVTALEMARVVQKEFRCVHPCG